MSKSQRKKDSKSAYQTYETETDMDGSDHGHMFFHFIYIFHDSNVLIPFVFHSGLMTPVLKNSCIKIPNIF
jgi:hypothetical protein